MTLKKAIEKTQGQIDQLRLEASTPIIADEYCDLLNMLLELQLLRRKLEPKRLKKEIEDIICECDPDSELSDERLDLIIQELTKMLAVKGRRA